MTLCPCGSGRALDACCLPYIKGDAVAPTAEALMRSRYTAYTQIAVDYIVATHEVVKQDDIDREATEKWAREAEWVGLEVVATEQGGPDDDTGVVEFIANYRQEGHELKHHERSTFKKRDGRWWYVDGAPVKAKPIRSTVTAGRNDPCPCGSGKKFKRCHGG